MLKFPDQTKHLKPKIGVKRLLLLFLIVYSTCGYTQTHNVGFSAGVAFSFGTHVNRIGLSLGAYYNYGFFQLNATIKAYYNFQSFGLKQKTPELQLGLGGQFGFGRTDTARNPIIGIAENNTRHKYSAGFAYVHYFDKQQTTQGTGILNANIHNFNVITENDLFGNLIHQTDRYRNRGISCRIPLPISQSWH